MADIAALAQFQLRFRWVFVLVIPILLVACSQLEQLPLEEAPESNHATAVSLYPSRLIDQSSNRAIPLAGRSDARANAGPPEVVFGTGRFVDSVGRAGSAPTAIGPDVTLDFANVDIRDVVRAILGDLLRVSYVVDPTVQGAMTLQTGRPIPRASVIDVLSSALQVNGLALIFRDGLYRIVPIANGAREAPLTASAIQGFVTRIIVPRFVAATDIEKALEQSLPNGATLRADAIRNVLIVSGQGREVSELIGLIDSFDVDYLRGLSLALLPLRNGRARDVANDVTAMIAAAGRALPDVVKVVPIQRMNAVLVTSMQPAYLSRVRAWVERLDRGDGRGEQQLYVYRVQHGRALELAGVLRRALGIDGPEPLAAGQYAASEGQTGLYGTQPGMTPFGGGRDGGLPTGSASGGMSGTLPAATVAGRSPALVDPLGSVGTATAVASGAGAVTPGAPGGGMVGGPPITDIRVTADTTNNALIILATPQEYTRITAALERLDIVPLQVLIEATIAEVTLTNKLTFGLQYFFKSGGFAAVFAPAGIRATNGTTSVSDIATTFPGFSLIPGANFAFASDSGSSAVLQALAQLTDVRVLSSPNILVLNNRAARLQVGDQVPVATQSAVSLLTPNAPQVNSIDYRDTGVILTVTPRVNASGMVLLDIVEEVSEVTQTTSSSLNSPTISQRRVTSSIAAMDGQTVGLGGLIKESRGRSSDGIPVLKDIPVLGYLFGARSNSLTRTELIVLITPRVVYNQADSDAVTRELRDKLRRTAPLVTQRRP